MYPPTLLPILLSLLVSMISAQTAPGTPCAGETAAILHDDKSLEIFFSGSDGRVYASTQKSGASAFSEPGVIGTIRVAPCSPVSAIVSGSDKILDLFVTGDDGPVRTISRDKSGQFGSWVQLAGGEAKAGTLITPVETGGKVFVFWVGDDGITYETELRGGNNTANVINKGAIAAGSHVTVLPRFENPNTIDYFTSGSNAHVYHYNFEAADETGTWTDLSYPSKQGVDPGAPVAAVVLGNGDCHLFIAALDGLVYTSVRTQSPATPFSAWTVTGNLVVKSGTPIYGVKTAANTIEIFVTGQDSLIYMSTWNGGFSPWEVVGGVNTIATAPITGISISDAQFNLFVTGSNKNVSTIEWNAGQSRDCAWWSVGEPKSACTQKAGSEGTGASTAIANAQAGSKKGQYIGIGVAIGLLVGVLAMGGIGFWFYLRWNRKLKESKEREKVNEAPGYAPAEMYCGPPEPTELPDSDSNNSLK